MAKILHPESCSQCTHHFDHIKRSLGIKVKCIQAEFNEKLIDFVNIQLINYLDKVFEDFLSNSLAKFEQTQEESIKLDSFTTSAVCLEANESSSLTFEADEDDIKNKPHYESTTTEDQPIAETTTQKENHVQCSACPEIFSCQQSLRSHELRGHSPYKCEICEVSVFGLLAFQAHHRSHPSRQQLNPLSPLIANATVDDRPMYVCDICPKTLTTKTGLVTHRRTHTRENWHECDICNKSFAQKNTLIVHMRTHTNERPFMCHHCSRTFNQPSTFKRHMLKHDGIKPFKCSLCDRAFVEKTKLAVHMLTHTGERPHVCPICKRGYTKKYHVKKHVKNFHNIADADSVLGPINERRSNIRSAPFGL